MNRLKTLEHLSEALLRLVGLLALDPRCQWTHKFELNLQWANHLKTTPQYENELTDLSASIRHMYGGMGSFNDYEPAIYDPITGHYIRIHGTENFEELRIKVFDLALELISID